MREVWCLFGNVFLACDPDRRNVEHSLRALASLAGASLTTHFFVITGNSGRFSMQSVTASVQTLFSNICTFLAHRYHPLP